MSAITNKEDFNLKVLGLRGVSILFVLLYHLNSRLCPNGYLGVDIFFTLSGFVITKLIVTEIYLTNFKLTKFYSRRIKRLLPSLILSLVLSSVLAILELNPSDKLGFFKSLRFTILGVGNFYFARNTDYFTSDAINPLLHTWSLGVEEQFYIFFPIVLLIWVRLFRNFLRIKYIVLIGIIGSLLLAHTWELGHPIQAFFLMPFRLWEILAGALIFFTDKKISQKHSGRFLLNYLGLVLIILAGLKPTIVSSFPSYLSTVVVAGTCLILINSRKDNLLPILTSKSLLMMGSISYSVYLFHYPIIEFVRYKNISGPIIGVLIFLASLLSGWVSTFLVENRVRNSGLVTAKRSFSIFVVSITLMLGVSEIGIRQSDRQLESQESLISVLQFKSFNPSRMMRLNNCFIDWVATDFLFPNSCTLRDRKGDKTLIMGDSHAAALSYGLSQAIQNLEQITYSGCPPLFGINQTGELYRPLCRRVNNFAFSEISKQQPAHILLHANWLLYTNIDIGKELDLTLKHIKLLSPNSLITVIGGVPQWKPDLPSYLYDRKVFPDTNRKMINKQFNEISGYDSIIQKVAIKNNVHFFSALESLCNSNGYCSVYAQTFKKEIQPFAWDYGHLTPAGSEELATILVNSL